MEPETGKDLPQQCQNSCHPGGQRECHIARIEKGSLRLYSRLGCDELRVEIAKIPRFFNECPRIFHRLGSIGVGIAQEDPPTNNEPAQKSENNHANDMASFDPIRAAEFD